MALFRKFFYKKPPEGLLEISERVYVFDYCFTTDVMDEDEYTVYIRGIIEQLRDHFPEASYMVFNMREGDHQSQISNILIDYDMTVMDYPRQYEGCPLLTMEMIHHFLRSGENWLQLGLQNIVLMHCERGGWPVLAFMLAALLIYRKQFTGEQKTLDMIYKQAPRELLQLMSPLNPLPSQLRYLQYISRRNVGSQWPPLDRALTLDCIIIRVIPNMDGEGGCRPIFRIYGQDPFMAADRTPKVLFSTPKRSKLVRYYKQADTELVKIDIHCHVQGDVVLECITLDSDLEREKMMFRVMFNTAFIRSNILMLNRDEIDILWDVKDHFAKNFRVEVLFSDMEASSSVISIDLPRTEEKEGLPIEAFAKVKEIFSNVDWLESKSEVATVLQQITASNMLLEKLDSGGSSGTSNLLKESLSGGFKLDSKTQNNVISPDSTVDRRLAMSSLESSRDVPMEKKIETSESMALPENSIETPAHMGQGNQPIPSFGLSTDSDSAKKGIESLESKESLENDTEFPTSMAQGKQSTPFIEPSVDANSMKKNFGSLESKEKDIKSSESKTSFENDTMRPTSVAQDKQSVSLIEPSADANSVLLESNEKDAELLDSEALLENDRRSKFEPQTLPEINVKIPTSAVQGKLSMSSFESSVDAPMEKRIDSLESSALPESNIKTLAPMGQGTQPIPSIGLSNSNSTITQVESLETKALLENDTKFLMSMAQEKQSIPLTEPSMDANSVEKKIGPLESKETDVVSLGSNALLENGTKFPTSMAQEKQSIPIIKPSTDASSMEQKIGTLESKGKDIESLESKVLFENDTKGPTSMAQGGQSIPLIEPSMDANSMQKKVGELESTVLSETDIKSLTSTDQRKQYSPLLEPPIDATSIKKKTEPQELQVALQLPTQSKIISPRMHQAIRSAPAPGSPGAISRYQGSPSALGITTVLQDHAPMDIKEVTHALKSPPSGTVSPSDSKVAKSVEPSSESVTAASPHTLLPSSPLKPSVDAVAAIEKTFGLISPAIAPRPPPPPPPPPPPRHEPDAKLMQSTVTQHPENAMHDRGQKSLVTPPPPPPLSSLPGTSPSAIKDSSKSTPAPPPPPPPSSTGQTPSSSIPPPPPPPKPSGTTAGPASASLAPPPPPPPASASKSSLPKSSANAPPVPPPPLPSASANGLSKSGTASLQCNANVPPVPGPPGAPFGAKGRGLLRANPKSQSQTKRSNLKPYHWLKLTRVMQGSLWAETQKLDEVSRAPEFDMSELESLFSASAPNSDLGKGGKLNRRSGQKTDKVQLIELRRAYNCEIMLSKVKIPLPDLMSSVLALDESVLDVDQVENLIKFCPTKEEMDLLKGYTGDKENLGRCEQFFLELMKVPRVESKLRVFSFKIQFNSQVSELRRDLNIVNSASEEIRNSVKLKRIMQTILSLGNALNHGTARGSALGFRLDSLLKLTDTRARNNKMTLMHYLCKVLADKLPELLEFPQDLVNLEASTKIQLKYLAEEMQAISKGLEKVVQELTASENDGPVSENFCQILKEFLSDAEAEVRSLAQLYANVGRNADALALYFGEDPARCPFEQVVSTLLNFVKMFVRAHEENCKQIEYEKKKAEKEAENEKLKLAAKKESENMIRSPINSGNIN